MRIVADLLDLYIRDKSFLRVHLYRSCTLILLMSYWMAQDKIITSYYCPHQGWSLQSLPNLGLVLLQLFLRNSSILEFLRLSNYQDTFGSSHFYSTFYFLGCIQVMFFPFLEKKNLLTEIIHAYCKRISAEMQKKTVKDFPSPVSTLRCTDPIFYASANIYTYRYT